MNDQIGCNQEIKPVSHWSSDGIDFNVLSVAYEYDVSVT